MQLNHEDTAFTEKQFPLVLVCYQVTGAANVGSLFRMSDAFGVEKIFFCGQKVPEFGSRMRKTARSTEKYVPFELDENILNRITTLREEGYTIISLEITDNSVPIHSNDFSAERKIALVIGEENYGISDEILQQSDRVTHINMYGKNSSMNVAQATNIALYEITKQWIARH